MTPKKKAYDQGIRQNAGPVTQTAPSDVKTRFETARAEAVPSVSTTQTTDYPASGTSRVSPQQTATASFEQSAPQPSQAFSGPTQQGPPSFHGPMPTGINTAWPQMRPFGAMSAPTDDVLRAALMLLMGGRGAV